jgi:hypothetical protein
VFSWAKPVLHHLAKADAPFRCTFIHVPFDCFGYTPICFLNSTNDSHPELCTFLPPFISLPQFTKLPPAYKFITISNCNSTKMSLFTSFDHTNWCTPQWNSHIKRVTMSLPKRQQQKGTNKGQFILFNYIHFQCCQHCITFPLSLMSQFCLHKSSLMEEELHNPNL